MNILSKFKNSVQRGFYGQQTHIHRVFSMLILGKLLALIVFSFNLFLE